MRASTVIFGIVGILALAFGILYVLWPIAPYHEEIIGMSANELTSQYPDIGGLMTTLVDVVGLAFLALGVFILWVGPKAYDEMGSWLAILIVLVITIAPLTYVVYSAGGPTAVMLVVLVLIIAGLTVSWRET